MTVYPKPSRASRLRAQETKRAARREERVRASATRRRQSYGGGGEWQAFRRSVLARDGYRCVWCQKPECQPLDVHHVRERVGMGGRKRVSVNLLPNAATLGRLHHAEADERRITPEQLERVLASRYGYSYSTVSPHSVPTDSEILEAWPLG